MAAHLKLQWCGETDIGGNLGSVGQLVLQINKLQVQSQIVLEKGGGKYENNDTQHGPLTSTGTRVHS